MARAQQIWVETVARVSLAGCIGLAGCISLAGCTIVHQREDIATTNGRIVQKQQNLQDASATHAELVNETRRLQNDIQQRVLGVQELQQRLQQLTVLNNRAKADSREAQAQWEDLRQQLQKITDQLGALEQNAPNLSDEEKRRRLAELQEKTRQFLKILVTS
jgi:chromosome segregation ATPase